MNVPLPVVRFHGVNLVLPVLAENESFFARVLAERSPAVLVPLSTWRFLLLALGRRRQVKKGRFFEASFFPGSGAFSRAMRFLSGERVARVPSGFILFDLLTHARSEGKSVIFVGGDRDIQREFRRHLARFLPDVAVETMLDADLADERTPETAELIRKMKGSFIYIGRDVRKRADLTRELLRVCPDLRAVVWGAHEFRMYAGLVREGNVGLAAWFPLLLKFWRWPFYLVFALDLLVIRLVSGRLPRVESVA